MENTNYLHFKEITTGNLYEGAAYVESIEKTQKGCILSLMDSSGDTVKAFYDRIGDDAKCIFQRSVVIFTGRAVSESDYGFEILSISKTNLFIKDLIAADKAMDNETLLSEIEKMLAPYRLLDTHGDFCGPGKLAISMLNDVKDKIKLISETKYADPTAFLRIIYLEMKIALKICDIVREADKGMLLSAIALRNIGQTEAFIPDDEGLPVRTRDGILFNDAELSVLMITAETVFINCCTPDSYSKEIVRNLCHAIASQNISERNPGAPATLEAKLLRRVTFVAKTLMQYESDAADLKPGEGTTNFHGAFYRPVNPESWSAGSE